MDPESPSRRLKMIEDEIEQCVGEMGGGVGAWSQTYLSVETSKCLSPPERAIALS